MVLFIIHAASALSACLGWLFSQNETSIITDW